jgi:tryptophanyl-tRNA synthetase
MHSLTTVADAAALRGFIQDALLDLLALGIDPERSLLWVQSDVPEVAELTWYLNVVTPVGLLQRCHSYKDKIARDIPATNALFSYPVLMAADILMYDAELVPVGRDQKQHLEVTRDIALKFNATYGDTFVIPDAEIREDVAVVPGLDGQKMSKSYDNTLEIFAPEKKLRKKVMGILTDSTPVEEPKDPDANLVYMLYRLFASEEQATAMAEKFRAGGYGYGTAKKELFELLIEHFSEARKRRADLENNLDYVAQVRRQGAEKARGIGIETLEKARRAIGVM